MLRFAIRTICGVEMCKRVWFVVHFVQFVVKIAVSYSLRLQFGILWCSRLAVSQFAMSGVILLSLRCQAARFRIVCGVEMCSFSCGQCRDLQFA